MKQHLLRSVLLAPLVLVACTAPGYGQSSAGSGAYSSAPTPAPAATPSAPASNPGLTLMSRNSSLGQILVDNAGRTVYLFEADKAGASSCYDACAQYWPPVLTNGAPQSGTGLQAALLGTTQRKDGSTEVTYAGHPLYYFVADKQADDIKGQGLNNFGGSWYVLSADGTKVDRS
ncbi:MAG TPA: hypothetical protein VF137_01840 [Candidatus Dormibacteraeota bacterium]